MPSFIVSHPIISALVTIILIGGGLTVYKNVTKDPFLGRATTTVTQGDVVRAISVSGVLESGDTAELAFPTTGIVSKVYVTEGAQIEAGAVLATLEDEQLVASRASALAELVLATADRQELISGVRGEERIITNTTVASAISEQVRTEKAQELLVENARRTLLNTAITARSIDGDEESPAPIISGTYSCDKKGSYSLKVYSSGASSGYSFILTGLETGTFSVSTDQPVAFATCGLFAKFTENAGYANSEWTIDIPNTNSVAYTLHSTLFEKAERDAANAIASAHEAVTLAQNKQQLQNAAPRSEALTRANARVSQAVARIAEVTALIGNRAIIAPFSGVITYVDILAGETAGTQPVITLLGTEAFELVARIPEIDVTRVLLHQKANVTFDADRSVLISAKVTYISPIPTQINGVAYFEIKLSLDTPPTWIRSGLNADIDIITEEKSNVLLVPNRYITTTEGKATLSVLTNKTITITPVELELRGTDGQAAISGIAEGTTIIAP